MYISLLEWYLPLLFPLFMFFEIPFEFSWFFLPSCISCLSTFFSSPLKTSVEESSKERRKEGSRDDSSSLILPTILSSSFIEDSRSNTGSIIRRGGMCFKQKEFVLLKMKKQNLFSADSCSWSPPFYFFLLLTPSTSSSPLTGIRIMSWDRSESNRDPQENVSSLYSIAAEMILCRLLYSVSSLVSRDWNIFYEGKKSHGIHHQRCCHLLSPSLLEPRFDCHFTFTHVCQKEMPAKSMSREAPKKR